VNVDWRRGEFEKILRQFQEEKKKLEESALAEQVFLEGKVAENWAKFLHQESQVSRAPCRTVRRSPAQCRGVGVVRAVKKKKKVIRPCRWPHCSEK
jgi:hypothetical protein